MNLKILVEKIVKKKVIRDGHKVLKKTSDKEGYRIKDGKEVKMSSQEKLARSKAQKKGAIKRKSSKSSANMKRAKSNRLR